MRAKDDRKGTKIVQKKDLLAAAGVLTAGRLVAPAIIFLLLLSVFVVVYV
jgi:hypothetical protein